MPPPTFSARSTNLPLHSFVIVAIALSVVRFLPRFVFAFPVYFVLVCALSYPSSRRFVLLVLFRPFSAFPAQSVSV